MQNVIYTRFLIFPAILFLMVCLSCEHDKDNDIEMIDPCPPIVYSKIWDCHRATIWTKQEINDALIGKWQWKYMKCAFFPQNALCDSIPDITVEFNANHTMIAKLDGEIVQTSTWEVDQYDEYLSEIKTEPFSDILLGWVLFCDDFVAFNYSYIDGCDNFFKRVQ